MATSINAYSVSLTMDASSYIDASKLSRQETAALKRDIDAAREPTEKLAQKTAALDKAYESGAISIEVYNRLLAAQREKLLGADDAQSDLLGTFSKLGNIVSGIRAGFEMVGSAVGMVMEQWDKFDQIANDLDDANDRAKKLGVTFNELGSLEFATKRLGGDAALGALNSAMGVMLKKGFVEAGETAVDAFKRAADEINGMATQTERAQRAAEIFGKSGVELLAVLQSGSGEIGEQADLWEKTNGLTQTQLEFIGQYNDTWEEVMMQADGFAKILVSEIAGPMAMLGRELLGVDSTFDSLRNAAFVFSQMLVAAAGYAKDIYEVMSAPLTGGFADALDFGTADKMLREDMARRIRTQKEVEAKEEERAEKLKKSIADKAAEDEMLRQKKLADEKEKSIEEQAKKSIKAAKEVADAEARYQRQIDKDLQDEIKRDEKLRADVAKGPQSLDAGSAGYAKYLADMTNSQIAKDVGIDSEADIAKQALEEQQKQNDLIKDANSILIQQLAQMKENGFKRIR